MSEEVSYSILQWSEGDVVLLRWSVGARHDGLTELHTLKRHNDGAVNEMDE